MDDSAGASADGEGPEPIAQLIVIGSSAGGIDALSEVVSRLPDDMPVPILLAQHLDPKRPSRLVEILQRRSSLAVRHVEDETDLQPATIYVLPPTANAEITDHHIRLTGVSARGPRPSIDFLFSSASRAFGEGLIAVILTGTGSDGAAGARDVKAAGGTVVIQNPATASYPGMPQALAPTSVDIVAELEAIGPLLHDLVTHTYVPAKPDEARTLRGFLERLRGETGIDFSSYKQATIRRRLQRRMAATGTDNLRAYIRYVQATPEEYGRLSSAFLIKVTEFFRDRDLFDYLREAVVPRLIEDARQRGNELRLWSAGCSTGEEAYSLAMLVSDVLGDEFERFNVRIFATDVDIDAVSFARRGLYPAGTLRDLPPDMIERHFIDVGMGYEINKRIRAITVFGQHDLGQRAPFPRVDLALCRNVLIYFTQELQKRALQLFAFSLRDGGYLALGKAESTTPVSEYFVLEQPRLKVYRRQGERVLIPPARIRDTTPVAFVRPIPRPLYGFGGDPLTSRILRDPNRTASAADKATTLLLRLPVGVVVVDRNYDIEYINGAARRMLSVHGPAIGDDLVHLVPNELGDTIRTLIDAGLRGETRSAEVAMPESSGDASARQYGYVGVHPHPGERDEVDSVVIVVTDATLAARTRLDRERDLASAREEVAGTMERLRRLSESNEELLDANQKLTTANAELRSTNEELLVANEEVQAATEEVETLNEELQATNEELETLNEELQATVEELNTTNDDLAARSDELQGAATSLEQQRKQIDVDRERLARVLDVLQEPVVVLDDAGRVVLANEPYRSTFGDVASPAFVDQRGRALRDDAVPWARNWSGGPRFATFRVRAPNVEHPLEIECRPLDGPDGVHVVCVVRAGT